jgi:hypothetical protein
MVTRGSLLSELPADARHPVIKIAQTLEQDREDLQIAQVFQNRAGSSGPLNWSVWFLPGEQSMNTRTLLIIVIVLLVLGGGYYGQGRWF